MKCVGCGCTDRHACIDVTGEPCHWVSDAPPLCSACAQEALEPRVELFTEGEANAFLRERQGWTS